MSGIGELVHDHPVAVVGGGLVIFVIMILVLRGGSSSTPPQTNETIAAQLAAQKLQLDNASTINSQNTGAATTINGQNTSSATAQTRIAAGAQNLITRITGRSQDLQTRDATKIAGQQIKQQTLSDRLSAALQHYGITRNFDINKILGHDQLMGTYVDANRDVTLGSQGEAAAINGQDDNAESSELASGFSLLGALL